MARFTFTFSRTRARCTFGALLAIAGGKAASQTPAPGPQAAASAAPTAQLAPVTVTGRAAAVATVSGWGDIPLARTPVQATVLSAGGLRDAGVARLADITTLDPAVSDAYNAEGYVDYLTVRGFVLDNRFNFRRDGLPINAETSIPLENKASIEILKGTSGLQSGTSAPGGLVNFVVKRPTDAPIRSAFVEWRQPGTVTAAVDLGQRFGVDHAFGVRLNAAAAHLDPMVRSSEGNRQLVALAGDWRLGRDSLLEAEVETSHRSQRSQPPFSLLGDRLPSAADVDPRVNLNNQPWSLPVVFRATTASLRWQQRLADDWRLVVHAATQRLRTDDRLAFTFGCSKEGNFDRYCSDGTFDFYDFRSDGERRRTDALQIGVDGRLATGPLEHRLFFGALRSRFTSRLQPRVDDGVVVGTGSIDGRTIVSDLPPLGTVPNTDRTERSTELSVRDAIAVTERLTAWIGVRHTALTRESFGTDGSAPVRLAQSLNTPMAALSYALSPAQTVYASWSRGVEVDVAPNRAVYANAGQPLPALKSRQTEIGLKGASTDLEWNIAAFDIDRPVASDIGDCDLPGTCDHVRDGTERHRGAEASIAARLGAWSINAGTQWLHARREGSVVGADNGRRPTNVPERTLKLGAAYDVAQVRGLTLLANASHESRRSVLPDESIGIPSVTRVDAGLRYATSIGSTQVSWRFGIDNLFDRRAWRESPFQYSHAYLYPLAPRTARASVQIDL